MGDLTIGNLAKRAAVGVETIRFYERVELLEQPLKPLDGGFRRYPPSYVGRIGFIRQAQELGFSLKEIHELLELKADPGADCAQVKLRAREKLCEVNAKIARLNRMGAALEEVISSCPSKGVLGDCTIIAAMEEPVGAQVG